MIRSWTHHRATHHPRPRVNLASGKQLSLTNWCRSIWKKWMKRRKRTIFLALSRSYHWGQVTTRLKSTWQRINHHRSNSFQGLRRQAQTLNRPCRRISKRSDSLMALHRQSRVSPSLSSVNRWRTAKSWRTLLKSKQALRQNQYLILARIVGRRTLT